MKEYNIKYRANHFLYMLSTMAFTIIWIGLAVFIITNLNLTGVAEGGDPMFNLIVILVVMICDAVTLTILLIFVISRVGNKNASIELSDTSIKINLPNKSFDKDFHDIEKIEYVAGGMVVSGGSIRPSSKYMLIIYPIDGKNSNSVLRAVLKNIGRFMHSMKTLQVELANILHDVNKLTAWFALNIV